MADDQAATATDDTASADEGAGRTDDGAQSAATEEQLSEPIRKILNENRRAAREAEKRAKAAEARAKEYEDRDKTELEKAQALAESASSELATFKRRDMQRAAAIEAGIPQHWARLMGETEADLLKDAKSFAESLAEANGGRLPDLGAGARSGKTASPTTSEGFSQQIRDRARR